MATVTAIATTVYGSHLWNGLESDDQDYDASEHRYAELCEVALRAAYPGATITVTLVQGVTGGSNNTMVELEPETEDSWRVERDTMESVDEIMSRVFEDGAWDVVLSETVEA